MAFDAIIIGAGHNGLCLALYLQRAGLQTLVLEQAPRVGGMSRTDEPLLPGFRHNPHANYLSYYDLMPMVGDFGLEDLGLRTVQPAAQHGLCFSDGRPPIVLHRSDLLDRTRESIAGYSRHDAETYCALKAAGDRLGEVFADGLYAPARRDWFERHAAALREVGGVVGLGPGLGARSSTALIDELFESLEMRTLLYQLAAEFGVRLDDPAGDMGFLGLILWIVGRWRLPLGGMQAVPDALRRAAEREGVQIATGARVTKIEVLNGRARSVFVAGRGRIGANRLVASSAGLANTLLGLVGDAVDAAEARSVRAFAATPTSSLASLMFCLRQPPAYRSAKWDPDIDRCFHTMMGFDDPQSVIQLMADVELGSLPAAAGAVHVNTLWDPSQAPAGTHVAGADVFMPDHRSLTAADWDAVRESFNQAFLDRWVRFAPNMTRDNVIADLFEPPGDFERKMRFREGPAQYRTEISGLYVCGASTYPGGGVHGACGYNAYQAIAQDLALAPPAERASGRV